MFKFCFIKSTVKITLGNRTMAKMVTFHGIPWCADLGITDEKVVVFPTLPAKEDDIFIMSYPKSGSYLLALKGLVCIILPRPDKEKPH